MSDVSTQFVAAADGTRLAVHEMGEGRPVLLLHGLFSDAETNWIKFGHAAKIAAAGFHVIMPDFRIHGQSDAPHDPAKYPPNILVDDTLHLIEHFALEDFDLGGFSLGARTTARLLLSGIKPRRAILGGMGLEGLSGWGKRRDYFLGVIAARDTAKRGDPEFMAVSFMKTQGIDPVAAEMLLKSFTDEAVTGLDKVDNETLVLCGSEDRDNGDPQELADAIPNARLELVPGTHMSSVTRPELGEAMARFLSD